MLVIIKFRKSAATEGSQKLKRIVAEVEEWFMPPRRKAMQQSLIHHFEQLTYPISASLAPDFTKEKPTIFFLRSSTPSRCCASSNRICTLPIWVTALFSGLVLKNSSLLQPLLDSWWWLYIYRDGALLQHGGFSPHVSVVTPTSLQL